MRSRHHSFKEVSKPSTQARRRFSVCFGKKLLENNRRISQPNLFEHGGNDINHSDAQQLIGHQQRACTMNVSLEQEEVTGNGRCFHFTPDGADMSPHHLHVVGPSFLHPTDFHPLLHRGDVLLKSNRSSHSSDSSSAYSGSDIIHSVPSSLDDPEVDLSGLAESAVDSDEEEELAESLDNLTVRDTVKECLDKNPCLRTDEDLEFLLEFVKHLPAFANMTLAVRRALCAVMAFVRFEKAGSIVLNDGEELDSWSVIINGHVEVEHTDGTFQELHLGESFGISPSMDKIFHHGVMRTKVDDCQFICVALTDYYNILHQGEENTKKHEEDGRVVLITEHRVFDGGNCKGHVVIRGTVDRLISQLVEDNSMDPCYIEDFLLTYRIFSSSPLSIANNLIEWFNDPHLRDKVTRVVLLWVNNHFTDFETDRGMMDFLEKFEACLENEKMKSQLQLLNLASATKARSRTITLARSTRDEVLHFSILGGYERGFGIFVSKVNRNSKAEEMGLKRGDQILEVNGQSFEHMSHAKALEILRGTTHLCITVRSNLLTFKEMLNTPENSPRPRGRKTSEIARLQPDPRARLSSQMEWQEGNGRNEGMSPKSATNFTYPSTDGSISKTNGTTSSDGRKEDKKGFMTLGHKAKLRRALAKISLIPKSLNSESHLNSSDDSLYAGHHNGGSGYHRVRATSPQRTSGGSTLFHSHSNPDLTLLFTACDQDLHLEYPEHVLKIYRPDQTCKYLLVHKETTAREVVMLSLREFSITDPSSNYSLCEVSVGEGGMVKQRRLPDQLQNLAERINLSSRYYLKNNASTEPLVPDELAVELLRDNQVHLLHLNSVELATQLTLEDFSIFRQVEPTEYVDDLFEVKSKYGTPMLSKFIESVNKEMFWVVSEICSESNLIRRMKKIKQFIKVARQCRECKNFNSMFAILSGLGHGAVSRLRATWEKLPSKYQKIFEDLQDLMDPSRNMFKYRALLCSENIQPPMIPFYPLVKKDLTFIHLGNDTTVDGLINFEKLRMIAKEVRQLMNMCSAPYDLFNMLELGGAAPSAAMASLNSFATTTNAATVKRRKKSSTQLNPKKMFEEAQMVRRVKAYLANLKITTNEDQLHAMSLECEPMATTSMSAVQTRRRHPSPTLSSASSNSTTSEGKKSITSSSRFGADSPQAIRKLLSLSESSKVRPHQTSHPHHSFTPSPFPSPNAIRRHHDNRHGRSHSDTTNPMLPVELSSESSSITSFNSFRLRKSQISGRSQPELGPVWSMNSSDSGSIGSYPVQPSCDTDSGHVSSNFDTHSNSSMGSTNSPPQQRSQLVPRSPPLMRMRPSSRSFSHGVHVLPPIPGHSGNRMVGHNVHAKMSHNRKIAHLGRAHSQDRMLVGYYSSDVTDPEDDGEV